MFQDEYDLALLTIDGIEARSVRVVIYWSILSLIPSDYLAFLTIQNTLCA